MGQGGVRVEHPWPTRCRLQGVLFSGSSRCRSCSHGGTVAGASSGMTAGFKSPAVRATSCQQAARRSSVLTTRHKALKAAHQDFRGAYSCAFRLNLDPQCHEALAVDFWFSATVQYAMSLV